MSKQITPPKMVRGELTWLGWCLTGHHDTCPGTVTHSIGAKASSTCTCPCHS